MRTDPRKDKTLLSALKQVAPGTPLRAGIDDIIRAEHGALIVIGDPNALAFLFSGGMRLDLPFSAQILYELAKMDGAIVISRDTQKLVYANVQLMPDPAIPSAETGTRHRTAERVAKQTDALVISARWRTTRTSSSTTALWNSRAVSRVRPWSSRDRYVSNVPSAWLVRASVSEISPSW